MTPLQSFIKQCREIESRAQVSPWHIGHISEHSDHGDLHSTEFCLAEDLPLSDANFIAFSRNNFLKLVEMVSILSEALEYYATDSAFKESSYVAIRSDFKSDNCAKRALERCEEIVE